MKYSQNNEEQIITSYFDGKGGRFLDIGAYDGKTFSNTLRLVELGWSGVCIEPDPTSFLALSKLHSENKNVSLLNYAFAKEEGTIQFYTSNGDAISTTELSHKAKWEAGWKVTYTPVEVKKISFAKIAEQYGNKFQFVNLDVESTNWELLQQLPLGDMGTELICVEHDNHIDQMKRYCRQFGLTKELLHNGENIILSK